MMSVMDTVKAESMIENIEEINEKAKKIASEISQVVGEDSTVVAQLVEAMHTCETMREQLLAQELSGVDETLSEEE